MTYVDVTTLPGTQKSTQQTEISQPCYTDTDKVHFPDGVLSTLPPYAATDVISDYVTLLGGIRSIHAHKFSSTFAGNYFLFGGNTRLYAVFNSNLFNITPFAGQKSETLGADPLSVTSGDATLTITWVAHGLSVGDYIELSNATDVGGVDANLYINNVAFIVATVPTDDTLTVEMDTTAGSTATGGGTPITAYAIQATDILGTNPIATVDTTNVITISYSSHGLTVGDRIKLAGVDAAIAGIPLSELNAEHIVTTVPTANTFTVETTTDANATTTGGGSAVSIFTPIAAGNLDQASATGYGTGLYGEGVYGIGGEAVTAQIYPRIWSFGDFGDNVVMCPGDYESGDGQKIYVWDGDLTKAPSIISNAPTDCNWVDVVNNHIVALREKFVQIAAIGSLDDWDGLSSYIAEVQRAWRLVSSQVLNEKEAVIFSPNFVLRLRYVGGADIWDLSDLYLDDGVIGPNAKCLLNSRIYWRGSRGSYVHDGSIPTRIKNEQNDEWIFNNINAGQVWKSFAYADVSHNQWYYHFPTQDDAEPNDYLIHNVMPTEVSPFGSFTLGMMDRTAAQKPGFLDDAFYMVNATSESVAGTPYRHFIDGAVTFSWTATTSEVFLSGFESRVMIDQFIPDSNQSGNASLVINTREYSQGTINSTSAYTIGSSTQYTTVKAGGKLFGYTLSGSSQFTIGSWKMRLVNRFARR